MTPEGKRLLLAAAAKLAAQQGSPHSLGLREVAREAGLNHNTFYRHFADMDGMMHVMAEDFAAQFRQGVREARATVGADTSISAVVVGWMFDQAALHPDIFKVALRELHGPAGPLRDIVRQTLDDLAADMCEDLSQQPGLGQVNPQALRLGVDLIIRNAVWLCLDYLEQPERRKPLLENAHHVFNLVIKGAVERAG